MLEIRIQPFMSINDEIAAALGKPIWTTDAFLPEYASGTVGQWRINPGGQLVNDWGYHSGPCLVQMLPSLLRKTETNHEGEGASWETWMSLTPLEVESQELGYRCARGRMAIMGLGMGWIAANAALNPEVSEITVVERDPDVIRLFLESGARDSIPEPARSKLSIVEADALKWYPDTGEPIDFLYADIWLGIAEPGTLPQVRQMQQNVQAEQIYFWGQELIIHAALANVQSSEGPEVSAGSIEQVIDEDIKLPLVIPSDRDYAQMVEKVIANRVARGLPMVDDYQS